MADTVRRSNVGSWLRNISILETISFLILLGMMVTHNETGVSVAGAIHGGLFLWYALLVWRDREPLGWSLGFAIVAVLTGPIGAIIVLERLRRDSLQA